MCTVSDYKFRRRGSTHAVRYARESMWMSGLVTSSIGFEVSTTLTLLSEFTLMFLSHKQFLIQLETVSRFGRLTILIAYGS